MSEGEELEVQVIAPEHVGELPSQVYAVLQKGTFEGTEGRKKTVIELTHNAKKLDHAVELIRGYGDPDRVYRVYYGRIVWESEADVIPEAAPVQQLFDPGAKPVNARGVRMVGDLPAKGTPGKVKEPKKRKVKHGDD